MFIFSHLRNSKTEQPINGNWTTNTGKKNISTTLKCKVTGSDTQYFTVTDASVHVCFFYLSPSKNMIISAFFNVQTIIQRQIVSLEADGRKGGRKKSWFRRKNPSPDNPNLIFNYPSPSLEWLWDAIFSNQALVSSKFQMIFMNV